MNVKENHVPEVRSVLQGNLEERLPACFLPRFGRIDIAHLDQDLGSVFAETVETVANADKFGVVLVHGVFTVAPFPPDLHRTGRSYSTGIGPGSVFAGARTSCTAYRKRWAGPEPLGVSR